MRTQDAYASGVKGDKLQQLADALSATNTMYKEQSKHCKMHCQPASKAKAKGKAKAAAKAAS